MAGILKVEQLQSDSNLAFNIAGSNVAFMDASALRMVSSNLSLAGTNVIVNGKLINTSVPSGGILQVVSAIKTDAAVLTGLTSVWNAVTGLSVTLTPISASSRILVLVNVGMNGAGGSSISRGRITRNSTAIAQGDTSSSRPRGIGQIYHYTPPSAEGGYTQGFISTSFVDSPSTTSAVTYQFEVGGDSGGTVYINRTANDRDSSHNDARGSSTITVMEIAG